MVNELYYIALFLTLFIHEESPMQTVEIINISTDTDMP